MEEIRVTFSVELGDQDPAMPNLVAQITIEHTSVFGLSLLGKF